MPAELYQPRLSDVLCGLEPGDRLTYRNCYCQVLRGEVLAVDQDKGTVLMSRPEWRAHGFGPELLTAADYDLMCVGW